MPAAVLSLLSLATDSITGDDAKSGIISLGWR